MFYFVYPRVLSSTFSGCQTMWDENGRPWMVFTFKHGKLIRFEGRDWSKQGRKHICKYTRGKLAKNSSDKCRGYDDVKDGLRHTPEVDIQVVPPERDPRR
jgi:hypothetical protein